MNNRYTYTYLLNVLIEEVDDGWPLCEADLKKVEFIEVGSSQRVKREMCYIYLWMFRMNVITILYINPDANVKTHDNCYLEIKDICMFFTGAKLAPLVFEGQPNLASP